MNLLFIVAMIVEVIFSLGFIFIPNTMMTQMGLTLDAVGITLTREFGSALLAFAILLGLARRTDKPEFKFGTIISLFVYFLVSGVILVIAQFTVQMIPMMWAIIGIHLIFVVWFGYFLVRKS
jgi:hypothetical protein